MDDHVDGPAPHSRRGPTGMRRYAVVVGVLASLAAAPPVAHHLRAGPLDAAPAVSGFSGPSAAEGGRPAGAAVDVTGAAGGVAGGDPARAGALPEFTHRSAEIEQVAHRPVRLRIDALGIDAPVGAFGRDAAGQLDVPTDASTVAWYREGSVPGTAGSSVLAAHVDYDGRRGVFFDLGALRPGDTVRVDFDDGRTLAFEVVRGRRYAKDRLPVDRLFTRDGDAVLTLITCGGRFDAASRSYDANTVVQAALR